MRDKQIHEADGQKTFAIIPDAGDEALAAVKIFARDKRPTAASFKAIGAFERAELSFFDWATKTHEPIPIDEHVEVASLAGDTAVEPDGTPGVHVHAVLGRRDGSTIAGHLNRGIVRPTLEVNLTEQHGYLKKRHDHETGLMLIALDV